jgi:hypothetical protein
LYYVKEGGGRKSNHDYVTTARGSEEVVLEKKNK